MFELMSRMAEWVARRADEEANGERQVAAVQSKAGATVHLELAREGPKPAETTREQRASRGATAG
jgi:hypothetical protein